MPIRVICLCGEILVARDALAGKAARCPKCGRRVDVPQPHNAVLELLDEERVYGSPQCPNCIPPHEIVCVKCGYNKKLGRKMETEDS